MGSLLVSLFTPQASADVAANTGFSQASGAVASDAGNQNQPQLFDVLIAQQTAQNLAQTLAQSQRIAANTSLKPVETLQQFPVDPSQEEAWLQTTGQEVIANPVDAIEQVEGSQVAMISVMPPVQPIAPQPPKHMDISVDTLTSAEDGQSSSPVLSDVSMFQNVALQQNVVVDAEAAGDVTLDTAIDMDAPHDDALILTQQQAVAQGVEGEAESAAEDAVGLSLEKQAVDAVVNKAKKVARKKEEGDGGAVTNVAQAARNDAPQDGQTAVQATLANAPATLEQQGQKVLQVLQAERKAHEQATELSGVAALLGAVKQVEKFADGQTPSQRAVSVQASSGEALSSVPSSDAAQVAADALQQAQALRGKEDNGVVAAHNDNASDNDFQSLLLASEVSDADMLGNDAGMFDALSTDGNSLTSAHGTQHLSVAQRDVEGLTQVHLQRGVMAHASVHEQIQVHIQHAVQQGDVDTIQIELHPLELGSIKVSLEVAADNATQVVITADRQETLDMLQRDAKGLAKALSEAGLQADSSSLQFSMSGDGRSGGEAQAQQDAFGTDFESSHDKKTLNGDVEGNVDSSVANQAEHGTVSYTASLTQGLDISV